MAQVRLATLVQVQLANQMLPSFSVTSPQEEREVPLEQPSSKHPVDQAGSPWPFCIPVHKSVLVSIRAHKQDIDRRMALIDHP